ncbi:diguanylate cyclase (GGDEF)-like protein [Pseudomonas fluvialis]|uniref:diguanylate cyclase n=1 Tax=Pseudomonas fluvialis TaxID=1793966 RepID=A0A7X0BQP1_9PSED|nr:GGDEF domain-containing protein [Pseudomonas fluvialis]MBB6341094.1 diguanylate cyclase (GGDEF)-like protein [Pseudomonas fluvialis]
MSVGLVLEVDEARRVDQFRRFTRLMAGVVMGIALAVLIGWQFDLPILTRVLPIWVVMVPNTSVGLAVLSAGLWCSSLKPSTSLLLLVRLTGGVGILLGGLTLLEYFAQIDIGLDLLLPFEHQQSLSMKFPGRMAFATALCLLLCGMALVLRNSPRLSQMCSVTSLFISLMAIIGYCFGVSALYSVGMYSVVAAHTALALLLLSAGQLASLPNSKLIELLTAKSAGGTIARSLLLRIPLIVLGIGSILLVGEQLGYYEGRFSLALMATLSISTLVAVILQIAGKLHHIDHAREYSQQSLAALNTQLEQRVIERTAELKTANAKLTKEVELRIEIEDESRRLSLTDELTGLHNRRSFFLLAEQMLRNSRRNGLPCLLFFVDLDGLKKINDAHGHEAGDLAIMACAQVLKAAFRENDVVARIGGDEFVALAVDICEPTELISERIRTLVDEFNNSDHCRYPIGLSIGAICCSPQELKPLAELLANADALMYADKQQRKQARQTT